MGLPRLPHLLGIEGLAPETISGLLDLSENYIDQNRSIDKRRDIAKTDPMPQSLMPAGLLNALSMDELRDLFRYLGGLGKPES
mgnify:CR=1 FL=1